MKTIERVLIHEDLKKIELAKQSAQERCKKINSLAPVFEFESIKEFNNRTIDPDRLVKLAMLQRPEIAKLAENISIDSLKVPTDIKQAAQSLDSIKRQFGTSLFDHLFFDGKQWQIDSIEIENYFETQCRVYATGEKQIRKYEAAKTLADFLNEEGLGHENPYTKHEYSNCMINWDLNSNGWTVNIRWIVG